jgi:polysaccharide export outer membrane protein
MRSFLAVLLLLAATACSGNAQVESMLIGPGDLIYVEVFDTPELAQTVRVSDAGTVRLELIGDLKLGGETPVVAAKLVEKALVDKNVMKHPQVSIRVAEYATLDISVIGQVKSPGTFPVTTAQPILKIIAMAGGLTDIADRHVTVERHTDSSEKVSYYLANDADQAISARLMVNPGDVVIVPRAPVVYVMGDVAKPGGYSIITNDSRLTVLQVVAMAGSANKSAVTSHVTLIRKSTEGQQEITVQLAAIQKGKQPDLPVQAGDILFIPFSWMKNMATNAASIAASTSSAAIYSIH